MKKHIYETLIIIVGNFILALGICAFITPVGLITGGASGIGIAVKSLTGINISYTVYAINIVMFVVGYFYFGKKFAAGTLLSTFLYPTFLAILERVPALSTITSDALLSTLYAGLCIGLGLGLVLRVGASTGGMDIPPLIVNKKTGFSVAWLINIFDCAILLFQVIFCPITIEQVLYGITLLNVTTGYHQKNQYAVMAVVSKRELHLLNDMILAIDPTAFIISNATHSVRGRGFTLPPIDL